MSSLACAGSRSTLVRSPLYRSHSRLVLLRQLYASRFISIIMRCHNCEPVGFNIFHFDNYVPGKVMLVEIMFALLMTLDKMKNESLVRRESKDSNPGQVG